MQKKEASMKNALWTVTWMAHAELVAVETCDCKNSAVFTTTTYNFKNGTITTSVGKRKKRSIDVHSPLKACDNMKRRCKDCISKKKNNAPKGSAEAWKTKNEP